tara:strand:- start:1093 stop:2235 length:1143 start_codon:yes stop_codon:yes gene_type:complete
MEFYFKGINFMSKIQPEVVNRLRTYQDILDGKKCYTETLVYKINKYDENRNILQTNYFLADPNIDIVSFVDSQVKLNKKYTYAVSAYKLVVGNSYEFSGLEYKNQFDTCLVSVTNAPSLKIIEETIFVKDSLVTSRPLSTPVLNFDFYKDINNRVLLRFNNHAGKENREPIYLSSGDFDRNEKVRMSQNNLLEGKNSGKIEYSEGVDFMFYEIYRTNVPPLSYEDFSGKLHERTPNREFLDSISPNTKYFYLVRTFSIHGNPSPPSSVYEVSLVEDSNIVPVVKEYKFPMEKIIANKKSPTEDFKTLMRIRPQINQLFINKEKVDSATESAKELTKVPLGLGEDSIVGKDFKIRVKSKSSGKQLDVNFSFTTNHYLRLKK